MKVLLLQDIKKVGRRHDIKEVSDGYARNFLIAKKLARPVDEKALAFKQEFEIREQSLKIKYQQLADRLQNLPLEFSVKAGSKGELFGSVKKSEIEEALHREGFEDAEAVLDKPLKSLGEHRLEVIFPGAVRGSVAVVLKPTN